MSIWDWQQFQGGIDPVHRLSLGEGATPLVKSRRIGPHSDWHRLQGFAIGRSDGG
jgi:hypothetical protein